MNLKGRVIALFLFILVFLMTGCGPILSTSRISEAKDEIAKAEAVNAAQNAPYEYTMAVEYMRKADELWGYSEFGYSADYAKKAIEMAKAAAEKSETNPWKSPLEGKEGK
jgi:uncharacterized protein YceK